MKDLLRRGAAVLAIAGGLLAPTAAMAITATGDFAHRIPSLGSSTDTEQFVTSASYRDINLRFTTIPYDTDVKPVRCDTLADISGYKRYKAGNTSWSVIASNVLDGTCYRLNFAAPTTNYFDVYGYVAD